MSVVQPPVSPDAPLLIGEWRVDPRADEISANGRVVKLEPLRMRLLMALAQRPGEVVLSNELLDTVWRGAIVTPSSLYQSVAQLRQLLGDDADEPRYIVTVPRKGYRLVAPVRPVSDESHATAPLPAGKAADPPPAKSQPVPATPPVAAPVSIGRRGLIAAGVTAGAALAAAGVWWANRSPPGALRIAVLPFSDRSQKQLDRPLANGLTEDVIRALGRHRSLEVIAYDAVARLAPGGDLLAEAARRLEVAFALLGDIARAGDRIRITTRLVALPSQRVQSEDAFDEQIGTVSKAPQVIAAKVADVLRLRPFTPDASWQPSSAYEMYVLGIDAMRAKTPESVERARRYFSQGIEIDPSYARNYSGLGSSWIVQAEVGGGQLDMNQGFARAEPPYLRALTLDPELVEAKLGLANVARHYQRYDEARRTFEGVIRTHPNNVQAHFSLGLTEENDGWPTRAIAHHERAAALDPTHFLIPIRAGLALMYSGRLAEAEARYKRSIALDPSKPFGYYNLGILNWVRGKLDESVVAYREAIKRSDQLSYVWIDYAAVCTDLGLYNDARSAYERAQQLVRAPNFPEVESGFVWLAEGAKPPMPKALNQSVSSAAPWERLLILAMAGEAPAVATVSAVEKEQAGYATPTTALYLIINGRFRTLDVATLFAAAGAKDRSAVILNEAEQALNTYEQRGVTAPAFDFHRARIWALRGDTVRALTSLQQAIDRGWRRSWWVQRDPALASLRNQSAFTAAVQKMDVQNAAQRKSAGVAS